MFRRKPKEPVQSGAVKQPIMAVVTQFLQDDDWNYNHDAEESLIRMGFSAEHGDWNCLIMAKEENDQVICYSILPQKVPEARRQAMAEFICRVNYKVIIGNFEMDFEDGEVLYKTSVDIEGTHLTTQVVKNLLYANLMMMRRYYLALMSIMYGNATPLEALQRVEGKGEPEEKPTEPSLLN